MSTSTSSPGGGQAVRVGDVVTVDVKARVEQPASSNDGIFTFDLDLIMASVLPGQPANVEVIAVRRLGVADGALGGGNGISSSSGLRAIHGGYLDDARGIDAETLLYSVDLRASDVGRAMVTPGPAVDPYGFDFVLYESRSDVVVVYEPGLVIEVVPEPGLVGTLLVVSCSLAMRRRRG